MKSLLKVSAVLVAVLAISAVSLGFSYLNNAPAAHADAPAAAPAGFAGPAMRMLGNLPKEVNTLEATVAGFAQSFTSARITTQELCVTERSTDLHHEGTARRTSCTTEQRLAGQQ